VNRLLTVGEEAWLRDLARVLREAPRETSGIIVYAMLREDLAEGWVRRLEEIAGVTS